MSDISSVPDGVKKRLDPKDKADRTTKMATAIIGQERLDSEAKTARLRALRLGQPDAVPAKAPADQKPPRARPKAATVRSLALQGGGGVKKRP